MWNISIRLKLNSITFVFIVILLISLVIKKKGILNVSLIYAFDFYKLLLAMLVSMFAAIACVAR